MLPDLALTRQARLTGIADRAARRAAVLWRKRMGGDFDTAWTSLGPELTTIAAQAQILAATGATASLATAARADGMTAGATPVQPGAFAGVDASGRSLDGLLYGAVTTAKTLIGRGAGLQSALTGGSVYLSTMVRTATLDTGRSSDLTAMVAHRYTMWVRVVSAGACSRCAILAGTGSAQKAFLRHPGCRCTAAPVTHEDKPLLASSRYASPTDYFESLDRGEQERIFTKAGAEAIRAGADPISVVSARRGARGIDYSSSILDAKSLPNSGRRLERSVIGHRADGSPILGYTTGEGTSIRGDFGKRQAIAGAGTRKVGTRYRTTKRIRLMPETLIGLTEDPDLRRVLLRDAGYLDVALTPDDYRTNAWIRRREELIREDRRIADAFYREHGIALG